MKYASHVEGVIYAIGDTPATAIRNAKIEVHGTVEAYDREATDRRLAPFQVNPISDEDAALIEQFGLYEKSEAFEIIEDFIILNPLNFPPIGEQSSE